MTDPGPTRSRRRLAGFAALCVVSLAAAALYLFNALDRARHPPQPVPTTSAPATVLAERPADPQSLEQPEPEAAVETRRAAPALLFRITALGETYGQLGRATLAAPDRLLTAASLRCERLHFAGGHGVCLTAERGVFVTYGAVVFDADFQPRHRLRLSGVPSRVRVAPDGRHGAITVFVSGHSYAATNFSTLTTFVDLNTGEIVVDDMEKFTVWQGSQQFRAPDFNFWGVTFARDGNRFYATLGTGGRTYLVEGDLAARRARVVRAGVECPALSPDNTRIAFKKRTGGVMSPVSWRLSVLDLSTLQEWELTETRSVDDQVEWLDDAHVLYSLLAAPSGTAVTHTWVVPTDGSGAPRLLVPNAYSPAVVRD
jgi:hypothetical protein